MTSSLKGKFPTVLSRALEDTEIIGASLAENSYPGLLVLLSGDLGAGKTALIQAIGAALGVRGIKSPTFAIESIYKLQNKNTNLVHADLYRLHSCTAAVIQLEEYLENGDIVLVEWGERWTQAAAEDRWDIMITDTGEEETRAIDFTAHGARALSALSDSFMQITERLSEGRDR